MTDGGYVTVAPPTPSPGRLSHWGGWPGARGVVGHTLTLAMLVAIGLALRWPHLWEIPLWTDESDEAMVALRIVRDGTLPLTNDNAYNGPLFNYLVAAGFALLGTSPWVPRLVAFVVGALTIAPTYLLGRELVLAGPAASSSGPVRRAFAGLAGGVAGGLLAVNAAQIVVNSHVGWGHCLTPLFTTTAIWLLRRAIRLHSEAATEGNLGTASSAGGPTLALSGIFWGLALQTHPTVAVLLPAAALFLIWKARQVLLTPWPYVAGAAFAVGQAPTIVNAIRTRSLVVLDAGLAQRAIYDGSQIGTVPGYVVSLGGLVESVGASLAGLVNDRVTPMAPIWHPLLLFSLLLSLLTLVTLWRSGRPLAMLLVLSMMFGLPYLHGDFEPIITRSRYAAPVVPVLLAVWAVAMTEAWADHGPRIRLKRAGAPDRRTWGCWLRAAWAASRRRPASVALAGLVGISALGSLGSLGAFYDAAARDGRSNVRLIENYAHLVMARRPGEAVAVDRAMQRDWTLTQGRLGRIVAQWLDLDGVSVVPIEVLPDGQFSGGLQETGGLAVLARGSVERAAQAYSLEEIASDAAATGPRDRGYIVVRATRRP